MRKTMSALIVAGILATTNLGSEFKQETQYPFMAIHAHLYHQSTGTINPTDLLDGKQHALWNTPIGEGEARSPSAALWILVEIAGPNIVGIKDGRLTLIVTDGVRILLDQSIFLKDWFSESRRLILPFLVYGTGCKKLKIVASLEGFPGSSAKVTTLERIVPFECGE